MEMTDNEYAAEIERIWQEGYNAAEKKACEKYSNLLQSHASLCGEIEALKALKLQFEEAREIIAEVSYSPEFKKWFYHGQEQDPCGVHAFTKKYAVKAEPAMVCLEGCPLPAGWDGSPKGCWVQHPLTREICQLAPDGHTIHERDDTNGTRLLRWGPEKPKVERSPYAPNLDYPGKPVAEKPKCGPHHTNGCPCNDPPTTEKRNDEGLKIGESRNLPYPKPISNDDAIKRKCEHQRWVKTAETESTCLDCKAVFPFVDPTPKREGLRQSDLMENCVACGTMKLPGLMCPKCFGART